MAQMLPSQLYQGIHFTKLYPGVSTHPDYGKAFNALIVTQDCLEGSNTIKRYSFDYLPHPSMADKTSEQQQARYLQYLSGAEFDGFPDLTLRGWLGKMQISQSTIDVPTAIDYLVQNADGDGTSLTGAIESSASAVLKFKYQLLLADYKGLSDVELSKLSIADIEKLDARATIKQYTRESLVNWNYKRINGVMQLSFAMLREDGTEFDEASMSHSDVEAYLILGLDDQGYYQQKMVKGDKGDKSYVKVNGKVLQWIPAQIICDEELTAGKLPCGLGLIFPICETALYRYRASADYKEAMRYLIPTTFTRGWKQGDMEIFKDVNGRDYIATGPGFTNNLPGSIDVKIESANTELEGFERYFDANADKVRALGGIFRSNEESKATATEADIDSSEQNAMLESVASQSEKAWRRVISYCAMFEGLWQPDAVETNIDKITVGLPRDFASPKLSVEEVRVLLDMIDKGVRTRDQVVKALEQGGWDSQEAQKTIDELLTETPPPSSFTTNVNQT